MSKAKEAVRRYLNIIDTCDPSRMDHKDEPTPKSPFPKTALHEVASCLPVSGKVKTPQDVDAAIKKGAVKKTPNIR
jgi:hypothetical protein